MANRKKEKYYTAKNSYNEDIKKLFIIVGSILLIVIIIYLIVGIFVTKDIKLFGNNNKDEVSSEIQYTKILASETFNLKDNEYYIIYSDSTKNSYSLFETLVKNKTDKKIYLVDTSYPLNKNYVKTEGNKNAQNIDELGVINDTLIKIQNSKNVEYIEGRSEILSYFK